MSDVSLRPDCELDAVYERRTREETHPIKKRLLIYLDGSLLVFFSSPAPCILALNEQIHTDFSLGKLFGFNRII